MLKKKAEGSIFMCVKEDASVRMRIKLNILALNQLSSAICQIPQIKTAYLRLSMHKLV